MSPFIKKGNQRTRPEVVQASIQPWVDYGPVAYDEPTGELDAATTCQVLALFLRLVEWEGMTLVVASHDPLIDEVADVVYTLVDGRIIG